MAVSLFGSFNLFDVRVYVCECVRRSDENLYGTTVSQFLNARERLLLINSRTFRLFKLRNDFVNCNQIQK